jgi:hypothetical protein
MSGTYVEVASVTKKKTMREKKAARFGEPKSSPKPSGAIPARIATGLAFFRLPLSLE